MRRFEGKVALITGASRGIGRATALRLAQEGATVVINYAASADARFPGSARRSPRTGTGNRSRSFALRNDVGYPSFAAYGAGRRGEVRMLDILVNNAGICPMADLFEIDEALWDRVNSVNLKSVFFATQEAMRVMIARKTRGRSSV